MKIEVTNRFVNSTNIKFDKKGRKKCSNMSIILFDVINFVVVFHKITHKILHVSPKTTFLAKLHMINIPRVSNNDPSFCYFLIINAIFEHFSDKVINHHDLH